MKLTFMAFILMSSCSFAQKNGTYYMPQDTQVSLLKFLWQISPEKITTYPTEGDYFYRTLVLSISEGESNLEGETKDRLYLLKGEYGEYPDGILYNLGDYYNITSTNLSFKDTTVIIDIEYGALKSPKKIKIEI